MSIDPQLQRRIDYDSKAMRTPFPTSCPSWAEKDGRHRAGTGGTAAECPEAIFDALSCRCPKSPRSWRGWNCVSTTCCALTALCGAEWSSGEVVAQHHGASPGQHQGGDVVALLPAPYWGYTFVDPASGKKVKVNSKTAAQLGTEAFCFTGRCRRAR